MVYELRCYTLAPGKMPEYLKAAETIGRPARGNNYGVNHGYWTAEFGALNQIWHLWKYDSLNDRERLRGELAKNEKWTKEYVPTIRPLIQRQDLRVMNAVVDILPPDNTTGNVYELRIYRTVLGGAQQYGENFKKVRAARDKYSPIWGAWTGEFPQPNEWIHLWRYKNLQERFEARAAAMKDPDWQAYL
ncbi:MAG TPA: NIPSNAP family protein, partial [Reyranella sp.]|nr:NIPSNAP family protein [Reyranella sp.]